MPFTASIVIPVWNRLEALGACLASLAEHTPDAQIILVDLGSERETERRLEQFAEVLEERVLLMHEPLNQGKKMAINRGMASAAAEYVVVLSPLTTVTAGWLDRLCCLLQEHPDVGIVCPTLASGKLKRSGSGSGYREISQGSFYCQAMSRTLLNQIGSFDPVLDEDTWCLADFSRRAWRAGFRTVQTMASTVQTMPEQIFGSLERRARIDADSRRLYTERWREPANYCLYLAEVANAWPTILTGARQGNRFTVITPAATCRQNERAGLPAEHAGITFAPLPRFFAERRGEQMISRLMATDPGLQVVTDGSGSLPLGVTSLPFTDFAATIAMREQNLYGREPEKE